MRAGLQLSGLGVPLDAVLDTQALHDEHARAMAQACVELFRSTVWDPFKASGHPAEGWPALREAVQRALPLASQAVLVTFRAALAEEIARAVAEATRDTTGGVVTVPMHEPDPSALRTAGRADDG